MSGQAAQVAGWIAFDEDEPLKTPEMKLIAQYLEKDCVALERILAWLRNNRQSKNQKAETYDGWYRIANTAPTFGAVLGCLDNGWYRKL